MAKEYLAYLSAAIFLIYGLFAVKPIFIGLGIIFLFIGLSDHLKQKNSRNASFALKIL